METLLNCSWVIWSPCPEQGNRDGGTHPGPPTLVLKCISPEVRASTSTHSPLSRIGHMAPHNSRGLGNVGEPRDIW